MRLFSRRTVSRVGARARLHPRRQPRQFENLEARQMLNAAPVGNDDTYTVAEDTVLSTVTSLPTNLNLVRSASNGHYYAHVPGLTNSWRNSETAAQNMRYLGSQGHLVTMTSAAEEAFVLGSVINHLPRDSRVYAGLTDRSVEGSFRWVTGEAVSYTHWNPGEPNGGPNTDEDYMAMYFFASGWLWTDMPDNGNFPGTYIVEFDGPFNTSLLSNDTDADGNPLTTTVVAQPEHGTLGLNANGTFTYTPEANFVGADSFTYKANDGQADSNIATVTINVTQVNDAPTAAADQYTTAENQTLTVAARGVLVNDSDLEGSQLTASLVTGPAHGQLTLNGDGSFTYTPAANYYGRDSFTYRASDGGLQSEPTTVGLVITSPRDVAPVAQDDTAVVNEDGVTAIQTISLPTADLVYDPTTDRIFASVTGSGGTRANTITPINPNTGALGSSIAVGVDPRSMVLSSDGRYIHAVIEDRRAIQTVDITTQALGPKVNLSGGEYAERVLQIHAIPGQPDAVMVTRFVQNLSPSTSGTSIYKAGVELPEYSGRGVGTGGANVTAVDSTGTRAFGYETYSGHSPFYILQIVPTGLRGLQTLDNGTFLSGNLGSFRYSRDRIFTDTGLVKRISTNTLVGNFVATNSFVIDEGLNRLFALTRSGTTHTIHIYDLDSLVKLDAIALEGLPVFASSFMRFGGNGIAFRGEGDKVVLVRSDRIAGVPHASVLRNDSDAEGTALTATLVDDVSHGTLALNSDGTFTYTPEPNFNGTDSFTYRASDGQLESNVATVTITVNSINDAPSALGDSYEIAEGGVLSRTAAEGVLANDTDVEGNPLSASLVTGPSHGSLVLNANGSFTYTPSVNFSGTDTFTYRANDADPSQPATVTIVVTPVNDAPVAVNDTVNLTEDTPITFNGPTPQGFTPVQWSANGHYYGLVSGGITWASAKTAAEALRYGGSQGHLVTVGSAEEHQFLTNTLLVGQALRLWIGLTDAGTEGNFRWVTGEPRTFTAWNTNQPDNSSGNEHYVEMIFQGGTSWLWNDINATFTGNGYVVEFEGPFNQGVLSNDQDVDNDALTAQLVAGPSHGQLTLNANGTFTYTPNPNFTGTDSFTYKARDGQLESNVATVTLNIAAANDPPVGVPDLYYVANTLTVTPAQGVLANDTDVDSPAASLTAQLVTPPAHGTLTFNANGSFTYTRGLSFTGSDTFTYRTSDGTATSAPTTVTIESALKLRTENVTIVSRPLQPVEGFFDVYVDVAPGFSFSMAGYDVALRTPAGSGVTLVSAGLSSIAHPSVFPTTPIFSTSQGMLRVTDLLPTGAASLDDDDGLFRVRFTVAPDTVGEVPVQFVAGVHQPGRPEWRSAADRPTAGNDHRHRTPRAACGRGAGARQRLEHGVLESRSYRRPRLLHSQRHGTTGRSSLDERRPDCGALQRGSERSAERPGSSRCEHNDLRHQRLQLQPDLVHRHVDAGRGAGGRQVAHRACRSRRRSDSQRRRRAAGRRLERRHERVPLGQWQKRRGFPLPDGCVARQCRSARRRQHPRYGQDAEQAIYVHR